LFSAFVSIVAPKFPELIKVPKKYPANGDIGRIKGEKRMIKKDTSGKNRSRS
jgi:hypothetical protein